jgi:hypothetical protein
MLKPHDILCALKIAVLEKGRQSWSFRELGVAVGLSNGEVYNSYGRLRSSGLLKERKDTERACLVASRLVNFLVYGVPTVYYPKRGPVARGMLTVPATLLLPGKLAAYLEDIPLIWPQAAGKAKGETLEPLYPSVPAAAAVDAKLYELLALVDILRVGKSRDSKVAAELVEYRLLGPGVVEVEPSNHETEALEMTNVR